MQLLLQIENVSRRETLKPSKKTFMDSASSPRTTFKNYVTWIGYKNLPEASLSFGKIAKNLISRWVYFII